MHFSLTRNSILLSLCLLVVSLTTPQAFAIDEGGGGGSEGSGGSGNSESSGGGGGGAAFGGHETVRIKAIVRFSLSKLYAGLPVKPAPGSAPLTELEQRFLCSMARLNIHKISYHEITFPDYVAKVWFPKYLAEILGRPVDMILAGLESNTCVFGPSSTKLLPSN